MLRAQHFLPSQLRAAYEIVRAREPQDVAEKLTLWFGESREFLFRPGAAQTPLVGNIAAAAVYTDHHGRVYAFADPSDYEYPPEPDSVPDILFTDRLFVAIPNDLRHAANTDDASVSLEATSLPAVDEILRLRRIHDTAAPAMMVAVFSLIEPNSDHQRRSSGFIQITGLLQVHSLSGAGQSAQSKLEALL